MTRQSADCYVIRGDGADRFAWARVFLQGGARAAEDGGYWGYVSILSDYGTFGAVWGNMAVPLRQFLAGLEFSYAMEKLRPPEHRMQFDLDESIAKARERVRRERRKRHILYGLARDLYDAIDEIASDGGMGPESFARALMETAMPSDFWEGCCIERYSPECTEFWRVIWPRLIAEFQAEAVTA